MAKYKVGFNSAGKIKAVEGNIYVDGGFSLDFSGLVSYFLDIS